MITTMEQAVQVQARRIAQGKRGIAKAVRRFARRGLNIGNIHNGKKRDPGNADDFLTYLRIKMQLPHTFEKREQKDNES